MDRFDRSNIDVELALWPDSSAEARMPPTAQSVPRGARRGHLSFDCGAGAFTYGRRPLFAVA